MTFTIKLLTGKIVLNKHICFFKKDCSERWRLPTMKNEGPMIMMRTGQSYHLAEGDSQKSTRM